MASLVRRLVVQTLGVIVGLGALVFAGAGTFDCWPAWLWLGVFAVASVAMGAFLLVRDRGLVERRLAFAERGEPEPLQQLLGCLFPPAFGAMFVVAGLDLRFGWSRVPSAAVAAANGVVALGLLGSFFVMRQNTHASSVVEVRPDQTVVTTGLYEYVRHPMYAAALLVFAATPIALGSFWAELPFGPLLVFVVLRLRHEERLLAAKLPGYAEYRRRTRYRLLPGIW